MTQHAVTQYRAEFDAAVTFLNGGAITATGFRVDVSGPSTSAAEVGELFVASLSLLMVDRVELSGLRIVEGRTRARGAARAIQPRRPTVLRADDASST